MSELTRNLTIGSSVNITIIAAIARNGVIGNKNGIPWHLPSDLKHFKETTTGHPIIMGRKTFESIGKPLPNRRTIVVTSNLNWQQEGCERANSLQEAIRLVSTFRVPGISVDRAFIVGGAQVYQEALNYAHNAIITRVDIGVDGDTCFPALDLTQWVMTKETKRNVSVGILHWIEHWERRY